MDIAGQATITRVFQRCRKSTVLADTYVAIPDDQEDDPLAEHCKVIGAQFYRGNTNDVLKRITDTAIHFNVDIVVRVTGDNPFVGPDVIDFMVNQHIESGAHFSSGYHSKTFPNGTVVSIINIEVLRYLLKLKDKRVREHIISDIDYIKKKFTIQIVAAPEKWNRYDLRYCLDYNEDLEVLQHMGDYFNKMGHSPETEAIINYLDKHEEVRAINRKYALKGY